MGTFGRPAERASLRHVLLVLVSVFGLAASVTFVWLGMRAVMDIGGACADGGPFVPVQPCPDGVPALLTFGVFGLFGFGGLGLYAGMKVGGPWAALPLLGWPALFLSLGWNFLEYGTAGDTLEWGWVVPGVLLVLMGGVPLAVAWMGRSSATPVAARFGLPHARDMHEPGPSLGWDRSHRRATPARATAAAAAEDPVVATSPVPDSTPSATAPPGSAGDIVDRLERLADLRRRGDLSTIEFERFKAAMLDEAERGA
jgi:hypothetical protein